MNVLFSLIDTFEMSRQLADLSSKKIVLISARLWFSYSTISFTEMTQRLLNEHVAGGRQLPCTTTLLEESFPWTDHIQTARVDKHGHHG